MSVAGEFEIIAGEEGADGIAATYDSATGNSTHEYVRILTMVPNVAAPGFFTATYDAAVVDFATASGGTIAAGAHDLFTGPDNTAFLAPGEIFHDVSLDDITDVTIGLNPAPAASTYTDLIGGGALARTNQNRLAAATAEHDDAVTKNVTAQALAAALDVAALKTIYEDLYTLLLNSSAVVDPLEATLVTTYNNLKVTKDAMNDAVSALGSPGDMTSATLYGELYLAKQALINFDMTSKVDIQHDIDKGEVDILQWGLDNDDLATQNAAIQLELDDIWINFKILVLQK